MKMIRGIFKEEWLFLFCLIILGAALRIIGLDQFPAGFHGDEAWTGLEARRILQQGFIGFWSPAVFGQTALPFYWTAIIFKLFGDSLFTTRLSFALLNVFSIPFFYLVAKKVFSYKIALVSTFLFITADVPLALARRADYTAANFSFFPALFFLLESFRTNRARYFILTGIFLGLSNHMYYALWTTPLIFLFFLLCYLIKEGKTQILKTGKKILLLLITYLIIASPIINLALVSPNIFLNRAEVASVFSQQVKNTPQQPDTMKMLWQNTISVLSMFSNTGDPDLFSSFRRLPVFDLMALPFFFAGIILALMRYRKFPAFMIYLSFLFFLINSITTTDAPNFRRAQISIDLAYLFIAIAMIEIYQLIYPRLKFNPVKKVYPAIGLIFLLVFGLRSSWLYFTQYSVSNETKWQLAYPLVPVANYINTLPKDTYVYFYSARWSYRYETLRFLLPNTSGENKPKEFATYPPFGTKTGDNEVYIFFPEYTNDLSALKNNNRSGKIIEHQDSNGQLLFTSYFLSNNPLKP